MRTRLLPLLAASLSLSPLFASSQNRLPRMLSTWDDAPRQAVADTVHPRARKAMDLGPAPADTPVTSVSLRFRMSSAQTAALDALLAGQQNPASPLYHQWLTPEQFAAQFGLSSADLATVKTYLQAQGLTVTSVARSNTFVTVSGTAAQIAQAFGTTLHTVSEDGDRHIANLSDPTLPSALAGVVQGIVGLNDFRLRPHVRAHQVPDPHLNPAFTSAATGNHFIAPGDFFTIYDLNPLLTSSIDGTGVTIAVMGQTDISLPDVTAFRTASGLSANLPTVKLYAPDPGTTKGDIDEAMLDVEWSGAVAPGATILYVNSNDVIGGSLTQTIDNNLAPIITISYGDCESGWGNANLAVYHQLFRQANAQGQTILGPTGDTGATDCDYKAKVAVQGLAVDFPASSPNVTAVGGAMFNEGSGSYFNSTNGNYGGSATSYVPEAVWNETASFKSLSAGGGGASSYFTKPAFQTGPGVPNDFSRDTPDLSFNAAASHDGYLFCSQGFCTNGFRNATGNLDVIGGTSVSTPSFAGVLALLEQKIKSRIGNANPILYGLANSRYSTAVYHDITSGDNSSPCTAGTTSCPNGGFIGYSAAPGYDQASGWGSLDAFNLVNDWLLVTPAGLNSTLGQNVSSVTLTPSALSVVAGNNINVAIKVASGSATVSASPTGTVQLLVDNIPAGSPATLSATGAATITLPTTGLASGGHNVTAAYSGDSNFAGSKASVLVDVVSANAADFTLTPASSAASVASGATSGGIPFTVTALNGFTGSITFAASTNSSTLTGSATPNFTVNPVVLTAASTSGVTVFTLSAFQAQGQKGSGFAVSGHNASAAAHPLPGSTASWKAGSGIAMAGLLCFLLLPSRRRRWTSLAAAMLSIGMLTVSGCSSSTTAAPAVTPTQTNTPAGTYAVTITATSTNAAGVTFAHNSTINFTVR